LCFSGDLIEFTKAFETSELDELHRSLWKVGSCEFEPRFRALQDLTRTPAVRMVSVFFAIDG
jgi:hypothetical protein